MAAAVASASQAACRVRVLDAGALSALNVRRLIRGPGRRTDAGMTLGQTITVAGHDVPRLGFGTMRLTGPQLFGEPADRDECVRVVRAAYDGGVRVFDTAWYYGPDVASAIVKDALHPYADDVLFVSKLGGGRSDDGGWPDASQPGQLRDGAERECRLLGVEALPVVHLRWMEGGEAAHFDEMLGTFLELREEGLIREIGLSTVSVEQLDHAVDAGVRVATVSNPYGPSARDDQPVLDRCAELGIPFLPYFSLLTCTNPRRSTRWRRRSGRPVSRSRSRGSCESRR